MNTYISIYFVNHIFMSFLFFLSSSIFTLKTEIGSGHFPPGLMASIVVEGGKERTLVVSGSLMLQKFDTVKVIIQDETLGSGSNYDIRRGSTLSAVAIGKYLLFLFLVIPEQVFADVLQNCSKTQRKTVVPGSLIQGFSCEVLWNF